MRLSARVAISLACIRSSASQSFRTQHVRLLGTGQRMDFEELLFTLDHAKLQTYGAEFTLCSEWRILRYKIKPDCRLSYKSATRTVISTKQSLDILSGYQNLDRRNEFPSVSLARVLAMWHSCPSHMLPSRHRVYYQEQACTCKISYPQSKIICKNQNHKQMACGVQARPQIQRTNYDALKKWRGFSENKIHMLDVMCTRYCGNNK